MPHRIWPLLGAAVLAVVAPASPAAAQTAPATATPATHADLVRLFADWRGFVQPRITNGVPDYGAAAMARMAAALPGYRSRLAAVDRGGWNASANNDWRLVEAEMNGLDFSLRVLRPWARDPSFYATVFADQSDVPAHEGPSAQPNIDLFAYRWPLSRADDAKLTTLIGGIPALLAQAKVNLADSQAHDLWAYGDRSFREQSQALAALEQGTLVTNSLDGKGRCARSAHCCSCSPHCCSRATAGRSGWPTMPSACCTTCASC